MGQRANLVIVKQGEWQLYYDHWCANRLHIELFWGPELATEFVTQRPPLRNRDEWLDEIWCEGSAIIDHDRKKLLWFGGEDTMWDVPARRALLELMKHQWRDWEIRWAGGATVEIGAYLGLGPEKFLAPLEPDPEESIKMHDDPEACLMLLTIRKGNTSVAARVCGDEESIEFGASQLETLLAIPASPRLVWTGSMPSTGLHLDIDDRAIYYWCARPVAIIEERVRRGWPGWKTHWLGDRFEEHLRIAQVDIQLPVRSMNDLQLEWLGALEKNLHRDASNPARDLGPRVGAATLNPWTEEARGSVGSQAEKRLLLQNLRRALVNST